MHSHEPQQEGRPQDRSSAPARHGRTKWVFVAFMALAAGLLIAEHRVHVLGALPWLILLACPLMHLFMHRGHSHGSHDHRNERHK